jgi:N-dimethylarginine dimethylaminohydrolase
VHEHQAQFVELLQSNGIEMRELRDFEELEKHMFSQRLA